MNEDQLARFADDNPNIMQLINQPPKNTAGKLLSDWKDLTIRLLQLDDNNEHIQSLICDRLELGFKRYGHGLQIESDTRAWGTKKNSWLEMAQEEALDGLVYISAHILRRGATASQSEKHFICPE